MSSINLHWGGRYLISFETFSGWRKNCRRWAGSRRFGTRDLSPGFRWKTDFQTISERKMVREGRKLTFHWNLILKFQSRLSSNFILSNVLADVVSNDIVNFVYKKKKIHLNCYRWPSLAIIFIFVSSEYREKKLKNKIQFFSPSSHKVKWKWSESESTHSKYL